MTAAPAPAEGRGSAAAEPRDFIRTFPCQGCGAKLSFAPGTTHLRCEYCGAENDFAPDDGRIEELDFDEFLGSLEAREELTQAEVVKCAKCGAEQTLPDHHFAAACTFCASPIVSKGYANRQVKPRSIIPFQVERHRAQDEFRRWVRKLWLAPNDLKRYAQGDAGLSGLYVPYWTYDCQTASDYAGERGDDYYVDEEVSVTDAQGRTTTETRRRKQTRWSPASGHVERFHDDVVVMASHSIPGSMRGAAMAWNLKGLVPYQPEYVSGFRAEAYQVGLRDGFPVAKEEIDARVHALVRRDIGGDQQRVHQVSTQYSDVKFKHVLLPVWISAYRYRDKVYRFLVNGQTGEVAGESPMSWAKVTLLTIGIVVFFIILLAIFSN
jgi:LSD1 subclass zinc finger protein